MNSRSGTYEQRERVFASLVVRNRFVRMLRIAVPAAGAVIFGGLVLQLFFSGLGDDFGFAKISIDRNNLVVDTPTYSSTGADGSSYRLEAASARAALDRTDIISLEQAVFTIGRPSGSTMIARADEARLETTSQRVAVAGTTSIVDSGGTEGSVTGLTVNMATQRVTGDGPVDLRFGGGASLTASGMSFDGTRSVWTFERATLILPSTPGESRLAAAGDGDQPEPDAAARLPETEPVDTARTMPLPPRPMPQRPDAQEQQ